MDISRFKNIRTLNDIKLEKARLRYDMLLAENSLHENLESVQRIFTIGGLITRISNAAKFGQDVYHRIAGVFSWFRRNKAAEKEEDSSEA